MPATVVNISGRRWHLCDVYCGRKREGMHFGNPFGRIHRASTPSAHITGHTKGLVECVLLGDCTRDDTIHAYHQWLLGWAHEGLDPLRRRWILDRVHTLVGKRLGCFCAPDTCHCDVLKAFADTWEVLHAD